MGERLPYKQNVGGSSPSVSTMAKAMLTTGRLQVSTKSKPYSPRQVIVGKSTFEPRLIYAGVVELADTLDLGSSNHEGSNPSTCTYADVMERQTNDT